MALFEAIKEWLSTESLSRWESHAITIFVAATCATIAAYYIRKCALSVDSILQENIEQLRLAASVFDNSADGVLITDADGKIVSVNPAFTEITGYTESDVLGEMPVFMRSDMLADERYLSIMSSLAQKGSWQGEIWNRKKSGEAILEWMTINRINSSSGDLSRYVSVFRDVTELRRINDRFRHQAFHDALTGLPNRLLLQERLSHAIERAKRDQSRLALIFLDLDGFKEINDSHGHDAGDLVLKEVANRFEALLRRGNDTVARYGGDEFVILIENLQDSEQSLELAERVVAEISLPMSVNGLQVEIGASVGMALFPDDGSDPDELIKAADAAMYSAKEAVKKS
ncbi:MAG: diguanylate cyclase [Betaproteobacteria bacterium]